MWGSLISAGVGLAGGLLSGKKQQATDPLASLRQHLQALAGQVPALVNQQKEQNAKSMERQRQLGYEGIGEDVYAQKGLGRTSIEGEKKGRLLTDLLSERDRADLAAEEWGIGQQSRILGSTAGMYPDAQEEETPWWETLGKTVGSAFDEGFGNKGVASLSGAGKAGGAYNDIYDRMTKTSGTSSYGGNDDFMKQLLAKFSGGY